jgi:hypothetical protein
MAVSKFYNATVTLSGSGGPPLTGGTALPHVRSVTIDYGAEALDVTEMGMTTKTNLAGMFDWTVTVEALQDFAASNVDAILFPLVGAAAFGMQIKPDSGAVSTSNPEFYAVGSMLENYGPLGGSVGEAQVISITLRPATDGTKSGALVRRTS